MINPGVADHLTALRSQILGTKQQSDRGPRGVEVFDAIIRLILSAGESSPGIDLTLHEAIRRRLAWGDSESELLDDYNLVFAQLVAVVSRSIPDPGTQIAAIESATEVCCSAARLVALAAVGRSNRERTATLREEMSQQRLEEALNKQAKEAARLRKTLPGV